MSGAAQRCRRKFLHFFPEGFRDEKYIVWERGYKWIAHQSWKESLGEGDFAAMLHAEKFAEIAARAVTIESRTGISVTSAREI